ncbi:MraY family glycosyltransferase [Congregibacter sp.]|uniref:MraY family glycosyltransferase n=1 Tax=Congregibacter sp. TaxID=2744308 RepID=UPI003F6B877A
MALDAGLKGLDAGLGALSPELKLLGIGLFTLVLALVAVAVYLPLARHMRLLDSPNHRSAHVVLTPSSGGLAIVATIVISLMVTLLLGSGLLSDAPARTMLLTLVVLCALGAWDDLRPLAVGVRLVAFLLLSAFAVLAYLDSARLSFWIWPLLVVAFAWLLNLYNFMDGIDGLAALQTVLVAAEMLALGFVVGAENDYLMLCAIVAAAYAGFLVFNWPPAKLFMGDAGSLSAGLLLGWLGLWAWRDAHLSPVVWLLLMSPFLLDTASTLVHRAMRSEPLAQAHSEHCYQRLARHWQSHRKVDSALLLLHVGWLIPLALIAVLNLISECTLLTLGLFPQLFLIAKLRRLK